MRLALICQNLHLRGGVARDAYLFARQLAELGADVHCYGNPRTSVAPPGVTFHEIPVPSYGRRATERFAEPAEHAVFAYRATRTVRADRGRYHVIYVTGAEAWEQDVARVHAVVKAENSRWPRRGGRHFKAARLRGRLGLLTRPQNSLERIIQRHQFKRGAFRRLVAVTEEVRRDLCSLYSIPERLVDVVPCPIDIATIAEARAAGTRARFRLSSHDVLLLFLGNDFYRKGLDEAIRVLACLPTAVHLVVVGSGDTTPFIRLARRLDVEARLHFAGPTENPETYLKDADVLFLPTREDVWGIALVEGMAAGVPVVTTSIAGASDAVRAARAGTVVEEYATDSFVDALSPYVQDQRLRRETGTRGRAGAESFDIRRLAPSLASALERAAVGAR